MNILESSIIQRLNLVFGLYELNGSAEYVGEPVSILEHSFQTAYLAQKEEVTHWSKCKVEIYKI